MGQSVKGERMAGLLDFAARFGTEERCIEHLAGLRWPDGFVCSDWAGGLAAEGAATGLRIGHGPSWSTSPGIACTRSARAQRSTRANQLGEHRHVDGLHQKPAQAKAGGVTEHLPNARITLDKFHVVGHASAAVDQTRRLEQRTDPSLNGLRWTLLNDRDRSSAEGRADLDMLIAEATSKRTARALLYREPLREILDRKPINVVSGMLKQWCTDVLRSKSLPSQRRGTSR
jgi:hypothetical protein